MPKVSIIMPSYNVVSYIRECMDSVLTQTLKDIEVIVADADSADGTREILEEYAQYDRRVKIIDDVVGSTGYAFNAALKIASGKYISIVESDDYIEKRMLEELYLLAEKEDLDYIKADFKAFLEVKGERFFVPIPTFYNEEKAYYGKVITPSDYHTVRIADGYMWKGIYKTAFLRKHNVAMHETKGAAFQDQGFLYQTIYAARRVMYINQYLYHYRRDNENSSVYSSGMIEKMRREYEEIEKDIREKRLSIEGHEQEFYYEKFARYKAVILHSHFDFWQESLEKVKEEFYQPFLRGYITRDSGFVYQDVVVLLNSVSGYIEQLRGEESRKRKQAAEILGFAGDWNIVICCAGIMASGLMCLLKRFSRCRIAALTDNDKALWGTVFNGVKVLPMEAVKEYKGSRYIIANEKNAPAVYAQLSGMGIGAEDIYICDRCVSLHWITEKGLELK